MKYERHKETLESRTRMNNSDVTITAPCRLHFGLLSVGKGSAREFGGVGLMIDQPCLRITISASERFEIHGASCELVERAESYAALLVEHGLLSSAPQCRLNVIEAPRGHVGLGGGTQFALAVAAGILTFLDRPLPTIARLSVIVKRGARSAIGTYGFEKGGLLYDAGKSSFDSVAPLVAQVLPPSSWRVVTICPIIGEGTSGVAEQKAFEQLPAVSSEKRDQLRDEVETSLLPAAQSGDFNSFSESVYRYGRAAGMSFAPVQGGPFASKTIAELVAGIRRLGVRGVGQSSWGPTVFALFENGDAANRFQKKFAQLDPRQEWQTAVSSINQGGAKVDIDNSR